MKKVFLLNIILIGFLNSCKQGEKEQEIILKKNETKEIVFYTNDSIKIFGDLYELDKSSPIILLFHQGGSNAKGEYNLIIPNLVNDGFNVLAIDQRRGGQVYGSYNRTVANIETNNFDYCDAYSDLEGALNFVVASGFSGNKILWGSSYSGSLAVKLANEHQDSISGVLAFSPASGGPMKECRANDYFEALKIPLLLLRPQQEMEIESSKNQFQLAQENNHKIFIATHGMHGSSMLVEDRVEQNVDENWEVVKSFLKNFKK